MFLTHEVPLPIGDVGGDVHVHHLQVQQPAVVGPRAELEVALLHVEGEPADVDVAGALQDPWKEGRAVRAGSGAITDLPSTLFVAFIAFIQSNLQ